MGAERLKSKSAKMQEEVHNALVQDCLSGDRKAQYRLYRLYNKAMFNTCIRILKSREDAEDVLQNSFIDVFTKLEMYRGDATIGAWIKRIVINNCINYLKKKRIPLTEVDQNKIETQPNQSTLDDVKIDVEKITNALSQLPNGYRVVFSLYAIEGYDHNEIAEILDISVSTSKSQYSRAKNKMKQILIDKQHLMQNS